MGEHRNLVILLLVTLAGLVYVEIGRPQPIDWTRSFAGTDKIPYGTYALRQLLSEILPRDSIVDAEKRIYNVLGEDPAPDRNYIFVSIRPEFDRLDIERLLTFVENGGIVFLAAESFPDRLTDTLGLEIGFHFGSDSTSFRNPRLATGKSYSTSSLVSNAYFKEVDNATTTMLGTLGEYDVNFVQVDYGDGTFYLNTLPMFFTSYYLLGSKKNDYAFKALSYLPERATIWDEYYKPGRQEKDTPLRYLLDQEALRWAYYLGLVGILLFVVVFARRRQRIIPEMAPPVNATLDFVETVGMLYLNGGSHAGIARKQIAYLLEQMRSTYGVKTEDRDDELFTTVAKRAGVPIADVRELFTIIGRIERREAIGEQELIELNTAIEKFNNVKER